MPPSARTEITLREIDASTVPAICSLRVLPEQEKFVAHNAFSIAQAYFDPKAWFRAIYADETPVGFVMLSLDEKTPAYDIWRFMIDARYQHMGYGAKALAAVVAHVRSLPKATEILVSCVPGPGTPEPFYVRAGFRPTGEVSDGENILRLQL